MAFNLVTNF